MVRKRTSPPKGECCTISKDIPDPIRKELDEQGGIQGLLSRIPDISALHTGSRLHQALSDPIRLTVMYSLLSQPLCVCVIKEIVKIADSSSPTISVSLKSRISSSVNNRAIGSSTVLLTGGGWRWNARRG